MKAVIIGATGLLGNALIEEWRSDEVIGYGSRDVDICDQRMTQRLLERDRPDWVVLAAAYADVDGCERNPARAFEVNFRGAANVALAALRIGFYLLLVSSDYVFDGEKGTSYEVDDPFSPINLYGRSKAEAELFVRLNVTKHCIVRTSWLFGVGGRCFPDSILRQAANNSRLEVVDDQRGCPTYNRDLARSIIALVHAGALGTVHATNDGTCSWFEFAQAIVEECGLNVEVSPISSPELGLPARRPANSELSKRSLHNYGISMRHWRGALRDYLHERTRVVASMAAV